LRNMPVNELIDITTTNAERFFEIWKKKDLINF
jgi:hypothetical protein